MPLNANMCRVAVAIGISLLAGCNSETPSTTTGTTSSASDASPMDDSTSSHTVRLAGNRTIHLPRSRRLVPIEDSPIVIDLATSQISGLIIHEPEENVVRVLGRPAVYAVDDGKYLYSSRGIGVVLIAKKVHAFYFWLSPDAAKESLAYDADPSAILARIAQDFTPCNARVMGRGNGPLQLRSGLSRNDVVSTLGTPDKVTDWQDGSTTLTYFGRVPDGDYDRLHLDFSFKSGEVRSVYLTH